MRKRRRAELAVYGNTAIERRYCKDCNSYSFVIKGKLACCEQVSLLRPERFKRESEPYWRRRLPSQKDREAQLAEQDGRCFYCENALNGCILRKGISIKLRIHWDHQVPYAYNADNRPRNFVAACHVCNCIKRDKVFKTAEEAKIWIATRRADKGYL